MREARLHVVLVRLLLLASLVAPACAGARSTPPMTLTGNNPILVSDAASFNAAVRAAQGGETIQLADGSYPQLTVLGRSFPTPVRIVGSRNATIAGMTFKNSSNLVLKGVTVTPPATTAAKIAIIDSSRQIVIDHVLVDGRDERVGAFILTEPGTSDVTVRDSELTNCGRGAICVRPVAQNLRVLRNRFYDCRSCDYMRGAGNGALIQGNSFGLTRNVGCTGGVGGCPHNNHIQIMAGGPWTIVGNSFGEYESGPAQIYIAPPVGNDDNPIRDVLIASNIFVAESGIAVRIATGERSPTPPPRNVRVVNNTILTGSANGIGAVLLHDPWDAVPANEHPTFANNIFGTFSSENCGRGTFLSNLVVRGRPCALDSRGDPKLEPDKNGPTAASTLVIDKADPAYAPKTDFYGRPRVGPPDLGAIELAAGGVSGPTQLTVPGQVARRMTTLARAGWRLELTVGLRGADTLRARLVRDSRILAKASARVRGKTRHTLVVPLPAAARRPGMLILRLDAARASGRSVSRSVRVTIVGRRS